MTAPRFTLSAGEAHALSGHVGLAAAFELGTGINHPIVLYLSQLAAGSRRTQATAIRTCVELLRGPEVRPLLVDWTKVEPAELAGLRAALAERYAPATVNRQLAAVRGVLRACVTLRLLSRDASGDLRDLTRAVRGKRVPRGRAVEPAELAALFGALDETTTPGRRDAAILALLYGCGLRRAELCALDLESVTADGLRVVGKGDVERVVPLPSTVRARLDRWIWARGILTGDRANRALFTRGNGTGRLGVVAVYLRVRQLAERAGIARLTPHDLRRSYASDLFDRGVDARTVQALMGHADLETSGRYDRRPARARAAAVEVLTVPERRGEA